jgi:hypothetical protein
MLLRNSLILLLLVVISGKLTELSAQANLVPNWDMESHDPECDAALFLNAVDDWYVPAGGGTTDYFNSCYPLDFNLSTPTNLHGHQQPHSGEGYIGFGTWAVDYENVNELLRVQLDESLESGVEYEVSCYLCLAEISSVATDKLHFHFTADDYTVYLNAENDLVNDAQIMFEDLYQVDSLGWYFVSDSFTASGGEQYLTIGDMRLDSEIDTLWLGENNWIEPWIIYAYYYIDDVVVKKKNVGIGELGSNQVCMESNLVNDRVMVLAGEDLPLTMEILSQNGSRAYGPVRLDAGTNDIAIDFLSSGLYLCRFSGSGLSRAEKFMVVR